MFGKQPNPYVFEEKIENNKLKTSKDIALMDAALQQPDEAYQRKKELNDDLTRWQQDLENDLEVLKYDLMNYYKDENGQWSPQYYYYTDEKGKKQAVQLPPMTNSLGAVRIINLVKRYLSRNLMMSNLDTPTIYRIMRGLVLTLVLNLGENYEFYEIDESNLKLIVKMVKDTIEPTLYRALNNGERSYLNTINRRIEQYVETQQPQRKGIFGV